MSDSFLLGIPYSQWQWRHSEGEYEMHFILISFGLRRCFDHILRALFSFCFVRTYILYASKLFSMKLAKVSTSEQFSINSYVTRFLSMFHVVPWRHISNKQMLAIQLWNILQITQIESL